MGARFLLDLPEVLKAAGIPVIEVSGWEFRSRSSGGYDNGLPTHIMWHHTASSPRSDGQADVNYICYNSSSKPIANLYLDRKGNVWVCAGGATNTNGKGHDYWGGGVPDDSMNKYAIGIEIANDGVGEYYTAAQHDSIRKMGPVLSRAYNIPVHNNRAHFEWAPDRKTDPAGPPSPWANPKNRNKWDMDLFRSDIDKVLKPLPPLPPPSLQGVPDVFYPIQPFRNSDTRAYGGAGVGGGAELTFGLNQSVIPANATAVALNVTVVNPVGPGYVTVWPGGAMPNSSMLNYPAGGAHNGNVIIGVQNGSFKIMTSQTAHLICDVTGYWTA